MYLLHENKPLNIRLFVVELCVFFRYQPKIHRSHVLQTCCRYDVRYEKEDFLLKIKKASVSDQGTYACLAENRVGKVEASAYLTIRGW